MNDWFSRFSFWMTIAIGVLLCVLIVLVLLK